MNLYKGILLVALLGLLAVGDNLPDAIWKSAQYINVHPPELWKWIMVQDTIHTKVNFGNVHVGSTTVDAFVDTWGIPPADLPRVKGLVKMLVDYAKQGTYVTQTIVLPINPNFASLSTVIVAATRESNPADPSKPVQLAYLFLYTTAVPVVQYQNGRPRGFTLDEISVMKMKMEEEQFKKVLEIIHDIGKGDLSISQGGIVAFLKAFLVSPKVQAALTANMTDPIEKFFQQLVVLQTARTDSISIPSTPASTCNALVESLCEAYSISSPMEQLMNMSCNTDKEFSAEYSVGNCTHYTYMWFLSCWVDKAHIGLFFGQTEVEGVHLEPFCEDKTNMEIASQAIPLSDGSFSNFVYRINTSPWPANVTDTVENFMRYSVGRHLLQPFQHHHTTLAMPITKSGDFTSLMESIKLFAQTWGEIAKNFKTIKNKSLESVVRMGFSYFQESSSIIQLTGIAPKDVPDLLQNLIEFEVLPQDKRVKFILSAFPIATNLTWTVDNFMYATPSGAYKSFLLFKSESKDTHNVDLFILDIEVTFTLIPDLLMETTHTSYFGGIWEESSTKIREVPKTLSLRDAELLQQFFLVFGMGKLARMLGMPIPWPAI